MLYEYLCALKLTYFLYPISPSKIGKPTVWYNCTLNTYLQTIVIDRQTLIDDIENALTNTLMYNVSPHSVTFSYIHTCMIIRAFCKTYTL